MKKHHKDAVRSDKRCRRGFLIASVIFLIALAIRLAVLFTLSQSPFFLNPVIDANYHDGWARALASDEPNDAQQEFLSSSYFKPPLYPYVLGAWYRVFGRTIRPIKVAQAIIGALGCVLVFLISKRVFGETQGTIAGLLGTVYWPWMFFDAWLLNTELVIFLNLLAVLLLLGVPTSRGIWRPVLAGLTIGLSSITWPIGLLFIAVISLWIWRVQLSQGKEWAARFAVIVFIVMGLIPAGAVTVRNRVVGGDWVVISSNGGVNFYTGNRPEANGFSAVPTGLEWERLIRETREAGIKKLSAASNYWLREGLRDVGNSPGRTILLAAKKTVLFFNAAEPRNNLAQSYFRKQFFWLRLLPGFAVMGPLALLGVVMAIRRKSSPGPAVKENSRAGMWLCLLIVASCMIAVLPFFVCDRFRVVAVPFMLPFAGLAVYRLWHIIIDRRWSELVIYTTAVVGLAFIVVIDWFGAEPSNFSHEHQHLGNVYLRNGNERAAELEFRQALRLDDDPNVMILLSHVLIRQGQLREAAELLLSCMEIAPDAALAHNNLGECFFGLGELDKSLDQLNKAVKLEPDSPMYRLNRAVALMNLNRYDDAEEDITRVRGMIMDPAQAALYQALSLELERISEGSSTN